MPYQGCVRKRSNHVTTDSYSHLARQLSNCMMIFNLYVGPVRTKMTITQNMNIYKMVTQNMNNSDIGTQNIPNSNICSTELIE